MRTSEKYTGTSQFVIILARITQVGQTEENWYMRHVKCKGKMRKSLKISMDFSLCETEM